MTDSQLHGSKAMSVAAWQHAKRYPRSLSKPACQRIASDPRSFNGCGLSRCGGECPRPPVYQVLAAYLFRPQCRLLPPPSSPLPGKL